MGPSSSARSAREFQNRGISKAKSLNGGARPEEVVAMVVVVAVEVGLEVGKVWGSCCRVATPAGVALGVVAAAAGAAGPL